jgi:hypothetical protein
MEISESSTNGRIIVESVYSLPMGKITIHLKGGKTPVELSGGKKVQKDGDGKKLIVYDYRNKIIAEFVDSEVAGWVVDND